PIDASLDHEGVRLVNGRVVTSAEHKRVWSAFAAGGWPSLSVPVAQGGQGLPLLVQSACDELFNRGSAAFSMLPTPARTGALVLAEFADDATSTAWGPKLASGEWTATICISEPDAGSDVGRIRTRATRDEAGTWRIDGEKAWISFGDHDLASRIGHFMIARSSPAVGVRGLSLFLVPSTTDDGGPNGVFVRRIEEKMGLHASPTCMMGFEAAAATLIGAEGRGLQQLFTMILRMRLSVGAEGIGVAARAFDVALDYARERKQGGASDQPPVAIINHVDIQRQLLSMAGRVETGRGLTLAAAAAMDLVERETNLEKRAQLGDFVQWILPIVKDYGARTGFDVASEAIMLLGGAGYTREWPVEQAARDARVFAIFEGTSGIQALDMLHRRLWRDGGRGLAAFVALARADVADVPAAAAAIERLQSISAQLVAWQSRPRNADAGAAHYLNLCALAAAGWIAARLLSVPEGPAAVRLRRAGRAFLTELPARVESEAMLALTGEASMNGIEDLFDD
ncbi:MAG: acyl-CoA dehydrogenase family protein, partial [Janthinobacterium lividum]